MCGLSGLWQRDANIGGQALHAMSKAMSDSIHYRGPDSDGHWVDEAAGVALGHRRLAIIDLSPAGYQPMQSADGRYVIVYNGEVYNFADLRAELEALGHAFRGHSDTEVILAACVEYGVEATVRRLIGMFAIALWDRREQRLWLVRDRLGIKPLYWGVFGQRVLFGSELKALRACNGWTPRIHPPAVSSFMRFSYVPAPLSIYEGVYKLEPGCMLSVERSGEPRVHRYWDLHEVAAAGAAERTRPRDEREAVDELEALLRDAVRRRMVADVPLGAFLSGGVDSSAVVALMQAESARPVNTFSIGFHEDGFDEAVHARAVAAHLGTHHTELYVEPAHALALIPRLPEIYDEPFPDSSQIPTYLVSELTRRHVTVSLSGDGGDELFAGYNRYLQMSSVLVRVGALPRPLRSLMSASLRALSPAVWDRLFRAVPESRRPTQPGDKLHKLAGVLLQEGDGIYRRMVSQWESPAEVVPGVREHQGVLWDPAVREQVPDAVERMQFMDTLTYLPDDILTKVDRASMAVSLEARVPLLDHRVVELAWRLPPALKVRRGVSKWCLREVLYRHVPRHLIERPKMGFGVPIDRWMRGELREWAETLLEPRALAEGGLIDPAPVQRCWREHLAGERNWQYPLWNVLMFQAWKQAWG